MIRAVIVALSLCVALAAHAWTPSQRILQNAPVCGPLLPPPAGYTNADKIFEDRFCGTRLDPTKWIGYMCFGPGDCPSNNSGGLPVPYSEIGVTGGLNAEYLDPYPALYAVNTTGPHLVIGNGRLRMIATPSQKFIGQGYNWASGVVTTENRFYCPSAGCYILVHMKVGPSTVGGWSSFWHPPPNVTNEIDDVETSFISGSVPQNQIISETVHYGANSSYLYNAGQDMSLQFHRYGMEYISNTSQKFYVDGALTPATQTSPVTGTPNIVIDQTIMNCSPGVNGPGSGCDTWHTVSNPAVMSQIENDVDYVGVYKYPP